MSSMKRISILSLPGGLPKVFMILMVFSLFVSGVDAQVDPIKPNKDTINPVTTKPPVKPVEPKYNSTLVIDVDMDCELFIDGEKRATVKSGEIKSIGVFAGDNLIQLKDKDGKQLCKTTITIEKKRKRTFSFTLIGEGKEEEKPIVADYRHAQITFLWHGNHIMKMCLNNENYALLPNKGKIIDLRPDELYTLALETSTGEKYILDDFLSFEAGFDTVYLAIETGVVKKETVKEREASLKTVDIVVAEILQNMVKVPAGSFYMGCPAEYGADCNSDEKEPYLVSLPDYFIGKFEVTLKQFDAFVKETGYLTDAEKEGWSYVFITGKTWESQNGVNWRCGTGGNIRPNNEYNHPVIHISWNDAIEFCKWLSRKTGKNFQIPTEALWEFAARGGAFTGSASTTKYSGSDNLNNVGWYSANSNGSTHPVGSSPQANSLGIYDMSGNVWEWCSNWYMGYPQSNGIKNYTGTCRVIRGGSWIDDPERCRVFFRTINAPDKCYGIIGFRLVLFP